MSQKTSGLQANITKAARRAKHIISFECSPFEHELLNKIADRAVELAERHGVEYDKHTALMDLTACHANGNPLDLNRLHDAPPFDFTHDVFGICRHINRSTGKLMDCFVPRCSMPV